MIRLKYKILWSLIISILFIGVGCGASGNQKKECKYKPPTAIFEHIQGFANHSFEVKGQDAVEKVTVPAMNLSIELYQSGCDVLQQEYRMLLNGTYPLNTPPEVCAIDIAEIFYNLSQQDPNELGLLQQWAIAMKDNAKSFQYNEKMIFSGSTISAKINKTHQTNSAMLTVIFSE